MKNLLNFLKKLKIKINALKKDMHESIKLLLFVFHNKKYEVLANIMDFLIFFTQLFYLSILLGMLLSMLEIIYYGYYISPEMAFYSTLIVLLINFILRKGYFRQ